MGRKATMILRTGSKTGDRRQQKSHSPSPVSCLPSLVSARGFTLIELLVSVVILASGAVLVMQGLAKAAQATLVIDEHEGAYLFALSKMAEVEVAARAGKELPKHETGTFQRDGQAFEWEVVTSAMDDPEVKDVTLTVSWHLGSQAYDRRFETLLRTPAPPPGA